MAPGVHGIFPEEENRCHVAARWFAFALANFGLLLCICRNSGRKFALALVPGHLSFFLWVARRRGLDSTKSPKRTQVPAPNMGLFITHLLGALSCALGLAVAQSNDPSYPVTVELDVVFPSNNTYAPAEVFPIIFALQNRPAALPSTLLQIGWSLDHVDGRHIDGDAITVPDNSSSDAALDPYYVKLWTMWLNGGALGTYVLAWEFTYTNCSDSSLGPMGTTIKDSLSFNINPFARQPNFGTDLETCPAKNTTIEISGTLPYEWEAQFSPPRSVCAIVADSPPTANPCAARLDQAAASSIAAELTASACAHPHAYSFPSSCPSPTKESLGSRVPVWTKPGMVVGLIVVGLLAVC